MSKQLNVEPMKNWYAKAGEKPLVISGPCSAESEEQVVSTAKELAETGKVDYLRAGIWKPRTRPNSFEGVGEIGLVWLNEAKRQTGLPIATEVANAKHVEIALKHKVDLLWIGARTTVNPFSVQEIADALKGVDIPVLVKNPLNPDLQLWIGAMERINQAGITKLGAIHRGFSSFEKTAFRNQPKWEFPIELKRLHPELEIICDPSHIAGNRDLISMISQKALDLGMAGLMIESHINPAVALSDAKQQVTPAAFADLALELIYRHESVAGVNVKDELSTLRAQIDDLDEDIFNKLATRMKVADSIGEYKREKGLTILQVNRWDAIIQKRQAMGQAMGLSDDFTKRLLQLIHKESIRRQTEVMNTELTK